MPRSVIRELEERLQESDEETRSERTGRFAELLSLGQPEDGGMLFGGTECINALTEARACYIEGAFLATILTAQICVEKLLAAAIELETSSPPDGSYAELLKQALTRGWFGEWEYGLFDRLRRLRNPYVHHRSGRHHENLERRALNAGESTEVLLEGDARDVIRALVHLVNQPAFALGPIVIPFDEDDLLPPVHPEQTSLLPDSDR
jgi:hypothetical protein